MSWRCMKYGPDVSCAHPECNPGYVAYGHVGYAPDYKSEKPIDVPSIMRAGGFDEGVKAERARVVAWLREQAAQLYAHTWADAIERGDHLKSSR